MKDSAMTEDAGFRFRPWPNRLHALPWQGEVDQRDVDQPVAEESQMDPQPVAAAGDEPVAARGAGQAAAETMKSALAMLRSYPGDYRDAIRAHSEGLATELKAHADRDVAQISEHADADIARIGQQTALAVAARRAALEAELAQEQARRDAEMQGTEADIVAFDGQLKAFESQAVAFLARVTSGDRPADESASMETAAPGVGTGEGTDAMVAAGPDEPAATTDVGRVEYAAAATVVDEPWTQPESPEPVSQGPASPGPASEKSQPESEAGPETGATMVSVRGLIDIASIATFMRPLSRTSGIESVQIRSVQNGEVSFAIVTAPDVDLQGAIRATPHFDIEVLDVRPGLLIIRATDIVSPAEASLH
jgi:hypothetical protein